MKALNTYIAESVDAEKAKKLEEKIAAHQQKIDKVQTLLDKKIAAFNKILDKYKKDKEVCELIPFEIFDNFKYISWSEEKELATKLGVQRIMFPYNPAAGDMYYNKGAEIRLKHGITPDTKYQGNEDKFNAADNDPDKKALDRFYWEYFTKCNELIKTIHDKEQLIKDMQEKVITISDQVKTVKAKAQRETDLFEQVPQLAKFIDMVGDKQYDFYIKQNEELKVKWAEYKKEVKKLDDKYGSEWSARCNRRQDNSEGYNKYVELKKLQPKDVVRTEDQIKRWVENWKRNERALLAQRITTEFGVVKSATLNVSGKDGNVNGSIIGSLKTATIETIYAGGYNIQCLHTRLLVHEK